MPRQDRWVASDVQRAEGDGHRLRCAGFDAFSNGDKQAAEGRLRNRDKSSSWPEEITDHWRPDSLADSPSRVAADQRSLRIADLRETGIPKRVGSAWGFISRL